MMAIDTTELNKHVDLANNSVQLLTKIATSANQSVNHMLLVIRWTQMELALLRTLEEFIRKHDKYCTEYPVSTEEGQGLLLQLDDFREQLNIQQQSALDTIEAREKMETSSGGTEH